MNINKGDELKMNKSFFAEQKPKNKHNLFIPPAPELSSPPNSIWINSEGKKIEMSTMSTMHLSHCINLLKAGRSPKRQHLLEPLLNEYLRRYNRDRCKRQT